VDVRDVEEVSRRSQSNLEVTRVTQVSAPDAAAIDPNSPRPGSATLRGWAAPRLKKRPGEVDPHLDERIRENRLETAKRSLFVCGVSLIAAAASIPHGLLRFGGGLSVAAMWAYAALVLADRADKDVPRWQRFAVYALMAAGAGAVIVGTVTKWMR
jgi:MFS family permease